jgi:integrase/recombinase XerD
MDRRSLRKKPLDLYGDPSDPRGMVALATAYLEALEAKGRSEHTCYLQRKMLGYFSEWAAQRGILRPADVSKPILERYQRYLHHYRKAATGRPLSRSTQNGRLSTLRAFFRWLARNNFILYNPASELELAPQGRRLPRQVLSEAEAEAVLSVPNIAEPMGLRDRAMLETFYSTGIRRMELIALQVHDVEFEAGTLHIHLGKGHVDRIVPIGERALAWIDKYLLQSRPLLSCPASESTLFVTGAGEPFSRARLTALVHRYIEEAAIGKSGSCHIFRHTMATLMLEGGADIRFIQQMLGHLDVSTTQLYTQVSIRQLKAVHNATHPAAKLERRPRPAKD